jgi:hypothetical protein
MKFLFTILTLLIGMVATAGPPIIWQGQDAKIIAPGQLLDSGGAPIGGGGTVFETDVFRLQDPGDITKEIAFDGSAITTSTTRTITMPDANVDLGALADTSLNNLGTTSINSALLPNVTGTIDIGTTALRFGNITGTSFVGKLANSYLTIVDGSDVLRFRIGRVNSTSPGGTNPTQGIQAAEADRPLAFYTNNQTGSTNSQDILVETGNVVDGDAGDIRHRPGRASGTGTNGQIHNFADNTNFFLNDEVRLTDNNPNDFWGGDLYGLIVDGQSTAIQDQQAFQIGFEDTAVAAPGFAEFLIDMGACTHVTMSGDCMNMELKGGTVTGTSATGTGGGIFFTGGDVTGASSTGDGGPAQLRGGNAIGGNGGQLDLQGGTSSTGLEGIVNLRGRFIRNQGPESNQFQALITLTADDTNVTPTEPVVRLDSDSSTATNRTVTLQQCIDTGQELIVISSGNASDAFEIIDNSAQGGGGNHRLSGTFTATGPDDTLHLICDGVDWIELSRSLN